jgi:sugar phosphate isomerase/epimerase
VAVNRAVTRDQDWAVVTADLARAAAAIGAAWVLTVFTSPLTSAMEKALRRCAGVFADAGAGMAIEFSPLGPISSIKNGMDVVRAANRGRGRAGRMIDSWHFCHSDSSWGDLARLPLAEIAYVQFADALAPESNRSFRETLHRRALPVDGLMRRLYETAAPFWWPR